MPKIYRISFLFAWIGKILPGTLAPTSPKEGCCCQSSLWCWYKLMGKGQHMQTGRPAISLMSTATSPALCNKLRSGPKRNECFISTIHIFTTAAQEAEHLGTGSVLTWKETRTKGSLFYILHSRSQDCVHFGKSAVRRNLLHDPVLKLSPQLELLSLKNRHFALLILFPYCSWATLSPLKLTFQPRALKIQTSMPAWNTPHFFFIWGWEGICYQSIPYILGKGRG